METREMRDRLETDSFDQVAEKILPVRDRLLALPAGMKAQAHDIRCKAGQPVAVCGGGGVLFLKEGGGLSRHMGAGLAVLSQAQLQELFLEICGRSVFTHEEQLRQGYISVQGCRVGVCGRVVTENGRVKALRDVSSLVFRIPRDCPGCGDRLFSSGADPCRGVLIAGEPGSGKTTLLRDIARSLSGGRFAPSRRLAVLDCREELSAGFDLGPCADVLLGCTKAQGLDMAIRTLSPEVVLCDELAPEDLPAVRRSLFAGVGVIATVHGGEKDVYSRPLCRALLDTGAFESLVVLKGRASPGQIARIEPAGSRACRGSRAG